MYVRFLYLGSYVWGGEGGEPTHLHICTHAHMMHRKHNMYSMILKPHSCMQHVHEVFFQDNDEDGAMAKYSDVMGGRYICGMIVV